MACARSMAFRFISRSIRGVPVGRGDTGVAKPLADRDDVYARSQEMYRGAMAHAVGGANAWPRVSASTVERVHSAS
jgi:hypothetical protein